MMDELQEARGGWWIGESIALEMDIALTAAGGYFATGGLSEDVVAMLQTIPDDWQAEWPELMGDFKGIRSVLGYAAYLADSIMDSDYSRATLAIRELTVEEALNRVQRDAQKFGLNTVKGLPPAEQLVDVWIRMLAASFKELGFDLDLESGLARQMKREVETVARVLRGGDLQARFWHWLDRFYYEVYRPWRSRQAGRVDTLKKRAITVLGAREKMGGAPDISWLSAQNPILRTPELRQGVLEGKVRVFFWVEPFGLADFWGLRPNWLIVSFAEPGALYENFRGFAEDVASRAQALADPTRLVILRMIRYFGMVNTEIAAYLGLARPTVSVHAKVLREAGLIRSRQEGRMVKHEIVPEEVRRLFQDLERFLDLPDEDGQQRG
jgi:DNA-binding transcriptional ArsR family regulator